MPNHCSRHINLQQPTRQPTNIGIVITGGIDKLVVLGELISKYLSRCSIERVVKVATPRKKETCIKQERQLSLLFFLLFVHCYSQHGGGVEMRILRMPLGLKFKSVYQIFDIRQAYLLSGRCPPLFLNHRYQAGDRAKLLLSIGYSSSRACPLLGLWKRA